ncbi:hypothetical protein ABFX02_10G070750 [Erythranthe guttata]
MHFGLYRTTPLTAVARFSSVLKLSLPGKMTTNRGMKSLTDNERGQPSILNMEEFPSLSATKSIPYSKIDLSTTSERTTENIGPLQVEASTSINDSYDTSGKNTPPSFSRKPKAGQNYQEHEASSLIKDSYDTSLPANFGKKAPPSISRKPKPLQNFHEHEASKRNSNFSRGTNVDEPFYICFTELKNPVIVEIHHMINIVESGSKRYNLLKRMCIRKIIRRKLMMWNTRL